MIKQTILALGLLAVALTASVTAVRAADVQWTDPTAAVREVEHRFEYVPWGHLFKRRYATSCGTWTDASARGPGPESYGGPIRLP
jgi:hypothetical protein